MNIIGYNPIDGAAFEKSDENRLNVFAAYLAKKDVTVTVRRSRGKDIDAACGQLANKGYEAYELRISTCARTCLTNLNH